MTDELTRLHREVERAENELRAELERDAIPGPPPRPFLRPRRARLPLLARLRLWWACRRAVRAALTGARRA